MKKIVSIIMVSVMSLASIVSVYTNVAASEITENIGIKIDKKQFPCELIREKIMQDIDIDKNGYLSEEEINAVVAFGIDAADLQDEEHSKIGEKAFYNKKYGRIDFTGVEIFKNIKSMGWTVAGVFDYRCGIENLDCLSKLPKLEKLHIRYDSLTKNYDFSKFRSLKKLSLLECDRVKSIKFGKNSKIQVLDLSGSSGNGNIDVSSLKHLKKFKAEFTQLKKITFGKKNKELTNICILGDPSDTNKKIRKLDFSKVKNLERLKMHSLDGLKSVKLGQKKKLKKLTITFCEKLKKVNLKGCNIPKKANINIGENYK